MPSKDGIFEEVVYPLETLSVRYRVTQDTPEGLKQEVEDGYERAAAEMARYARDNQFLYGPITFEYVRDNYDKTKNVVSLVAWAPAVRNPNPLHASMVQNLLSRPDQILRNGIRIKEYRGEAV